MSIMIETKLTHKQGFLRGKGREMGKKVNVNEKIKEKINYQGLMAVIA